MLESAVCVSTFWVSSSPVLILDRVNCFAAGVLSLSSVDDSDKSSDKRLATFSHLEILMVLKI